MNLGTWGVALNWIAVGWMVLMSIVLMFPQYLPVTAAYMNYTIFVLFGVAVVYTMNWYLYARTRYHVS